MIAITDPCIFTDYNRPQKAQKLVHEALSKPAANRDFESSSYQAQARAQIAAEKVRTVEGYLAEMLKASPGFQINPINYRQESLEYHFISERVLVLPISQFDHFIHVSQVLTGSNRPPQ